jgi:subtilisin family serine protease
MHRPLLPTLAVAALAVTGAVSVATAAGASTTGADQTYLVLAKSQASLGNAAQTIAKAGGSLVAEYGQLGVIVAHSTDANFVANITSDTRIDSASATTGFGVRPFTDDGADAANTGDLPNAPATDSDSLSGLQWDMRQIHTPEAHAITGGSPSVLVGDIDTGLDYTHPDLAPNVSDADSVNCLSGAPVPGAVAANDDNGHGTHTAGTIAAASNGIGIVGVAPNVKIAGIKAGDSTGTFFPQAVVCAFYWAGVRHMDVTNNSYFADPYLYNCRNDATQRAIWKAEQRAIRFAMNQGVTVVSAAGNEADDLSHPTVDNTSPDTGPTPPVTRDVTNACVVIPVEIPGVIGVSADGHNFQDTGGYLKSYYSSYGVSAIDVVAPGGDSRFGRNAEAPNGRVLSTWPSTVPCGRPATDPTYPTAAYCYAQGTSMASPHVAGVAALVISRFGTTSNAGNGKMRPGTVEAYIQQTADPQPCPSTLPAGYQAALPSPSGAPQVCQGGTGHNSWYGNGQVNALNAVTKTNG